MEDRTARPSQSLVTWALVSLNAGVFLLMVLSGAPLLLPDGALLEAFGAVDASDVWEGQIWRLASGMFVHAAVWHLALNLWVLSQVGRLLEQVLGAARYLLVYLVSGVVGFAASLLLHPGLTAGASGAIFGVVGGLLALAAVARDQPVSRFLLSALVPFVAATLAIGVLLPFVDNSAHVGGLVAGFLLTYGLLADETGTRLLALREAGLLGPREAVALRPRFGGVALVVSGALFVVLVPLALRPVFSPRYHLARAHAALERRDLEAAKAYAERAVELAPADGSVLVLKGRLLLEGSVLDRARARAFFAEGMKRLDDDVEDAFALAFLEAGGRGDEEMFFRDAKLTVGLCDAALLATKDRPDAGLLNNCAWVLAKSDDEAVRDPKRALRLAERAVRLARPPDGPATVSDEELAAYLHTYAYALAENGDPDEARIVMERVRAEGLSRRAMYEEERQRFAAMAREAARETASDDEEPRVNGLSPKPGREADPRQSEPAQAPEIEGMRALPAPEAQAEAEPAPQEP